MKIVLKFKDGLTGTQDWGEAFRHQGDLLQAIKTGKENNAGISFTDQHGNEHKKTWNDVYSIELILE